ncbi:sensor histidine kinase [Paenibacillus sp. LHD-117]|uniref:sensor histidine kinase n=1 Tax=Paenibacillus sp. LHD-117 TaxID=3071412 RepID=UPI0027E19972|nr:sensor histidine kinase [Paenibacillus sp. LHD-117]MDQ6417949.1 sensor histidine kinase [Paenibacillus sp. LHD-117]
MISPPSVRNFSIFTKLVASLLIVMLPIYGISFYMNQTAEENVHNEISKAVVSSVHFYVSSFETEMQRLMRLNKELIFDDDIQKMVTIAEAMDDYTRAQTILSIKNKLYLLKTSSPYVNDVRVYIPTLGRGIFASSFDNHIAEDELGALEKAGNRYNAPFTYWKNRLLLSEVYPPPFQNVDTTIALAVELSNEQLRHSLNQISQVKDSGAAFVNIEQNWIFSDGKTSGDIMAALQQLIAEPQFKDQTSGQGNLTVQGVDYIATFEYSKLLDTYLAVYVPKEEVLGPLAKYRTLLWLLSIISTAVLVLFAYWIFRLIHQPLKRLVISFRQVEKGNLKVEIHHQNKDEFHYLYEQFNAMVRQLNHLIREVYEERIRSQQSELKQLQSQINPHFLYNSFFILQGLVRMNDNATAETMMQYLGDYFKFITRTGTEHVTLEQEISHARAYTDIQSIRFYGNIEVEWGDVPQSYAKLQVPRIILQPLVENAYVHALEDKLEGGLLNIRFEERDGYLLIIVEDNGDKLRDDALMTIQEQLRGRKPIKEYTGLFNVHRRLQLKYGDHFGLHAARSVWGGLRVELKIPYQEEERHV